MSHFYFRQKLTDFIESADIRNDIGFIEKNKFIIYPGSRGGSHEDVECWLFKTFVNDLIMAFGFYANFSDNDLICKVGKMDTLQIKGLGASIQFNGNECIKPVENTNYKLLHYGKVTVGSSISRDKLANYICELTPDIAKHFRIHTGDSFPVFLGSTLEFDKLIGNLFLYSYAIEQAKRSIRGEELLLNYFN